MTERRFGAFAMGFLLLAGACSAAPTDETTQPPHDGERALGATSTALEAKPMPVVYDTDVDFDDAAALAYLARAHKLGLIDLRAVTVTNNGAGLPGQALLHVRCLLQRFGLTDIPVADGSPTGENAFPAWVRSLIDTILSDTLSDCTLAPEPSSQSAADLIAAQIAGTTTPLTLLATGPVSNVADALGRFDEATLAARLHSVVTEGGAVHIAGDLFGPDPRFDGTQTPNYWVAPHAAQELFDRTPTGKLTMVAHDATQYVPITFPFLDRLSASAMTAEATFVSTMMSHPFIQAGLQQGGAAFWWDPLAATAIVDHAHEILGYEWDHVDMIEDGPSAGRTLLVAATDPGVWMRVAVFADQSAFESDFLDTLNGGAQ